MPGCGLVFCLLLIALETVARWRMPTIRVPLDVHNSEPSKLAIARIPTLAEHFVLSDDDYYVIPPANGTRKSIAPLFFNSEDGIPTQPGVTFMSHRPIPFLRSAYVACANGESDQNIERVLTSRTSREALPPGGMIERRKHKFSVDRLPHWCVRMVHNGTARTYRTEQWILHNQESLPPRQLQDAVDHVRKAARSCFLFGQRRNASTNEKIYHSRASAALFLRLIENLRPNFITVNDDWPTESDAAYAHAIQPFHAFLVKMFPQRQPWETDEFDSAQPISMSSVAGNNAEREP